MRRIPDASTCGSTPGRCRSAQVHYPFENRDWFEHHYPGDFIVEYIGQTRGWFYTLPVVVSVFLTRRIAHSLDRVRQAAAQVADGDYTVRVPDVGMGAEFDDLARSFNTMAADLGRIEQTRTRLLGDLAHEMRTPVATLDGYLEGIQDVVPADEETLGMLRDQVSRLARLAQDISLVTTAEEGRLTMDRRPCGSARSSTRRWRRPLRGTPPGRSAWASPLRSNPVASRSGGRRFALPGAQRLADGSLPCRAAWPHRSMTRRLAPSLGPGPQQSGCLTLRPRRPLVFGGPGFRTGVWAWEFRPGVCAGDAEMALTGW
ncbi:HAMP domain-containing protein [Georgenia sp. SUBG003]|uniref:HAMP domain-containing protein n=1 Tax=Georgenia sp. SUBG003 TaxID=1497974 RepID=UPI003AB822D5